MEAVIRRVDQIEADVECLLCGRLIGRLFGASWRSPADRRAARTISNLTIYRENVPGAPARRVTSFDRFRCFECGGAGLVSEVSVRALNEKLPTTHCPIHGERKPGPGRPPRGCTCALSRAAA